MNIHYTDIAAESETATLDTSSFVDAGRASFMRWFKDCAANGLTITETPMVFILKANGTPIDYDNFNFAESPKLNVVENIRSLKNHVTIRTHYPDRHSTYNEEQDTYTYKGQTARGKTMSGFSDELAAELHLANVNESSLIYPEIFVNKHFQFGQVAESTNSLISQYQSRYESFKTIIGSEIVDNPRHGVNLIHLGCLNIEPANDIEVINSISF